MQETKTYTVVVAAVASDPEVTSGKNVKNKNCKENWLDIEVNVK